MEKQNLENKIPNDTKVSLCMFINPPKELKCGMDLYALPENLRNVLNGHTFKVYTSVNGNEIYHKAIVTKRTQNKIYVKIGGEIN